MKKVKTLFYYSFYSSFIYIYIMKRTNRQRNRKRQGRTFKRGGIEPEETPEQGQQGQQEAIHEEPERVPEQEEDIVYEPREALYEKPKSLYTEIPKDLGLTLEEMKQSFEGVKRNGFEIKTTQINTLLELLIKQTNPLSNDEKIALKEIRVIIEQKKPLIGQNEFSILGLLFPFLSSSQSEEDDPAYNLAIEILQKVKDFSLTESDLRLLSAIYCKNNERGFRQNEYKILGRRVYSRASIVQQKINKIVKLLNSSNRSSYNFTLCKGGKKQSKKKANNKKAKNQSKKKKTYCIRA